MSKWQPIETAPKDARILVCNPGDSPVIACWGYAFLERFNRGTRKSEGLYGWMTGGTSQFNPGKSAVWHALPEPPK